MTQGRSGALWAENGHNMNITGCCNSDTLPKPRSLSLRTAAIEQFRQLGEIDCHLPRLIRGQKAGVSCRVRVGSPLEPAKFPPSGIRAGDSALGRAEHA